MSRDDAYVTIRTVGGLLPPDLLARVAAATDLPGLTPNDYHLGAGESLRAGANRSWQYLLGTWSAFRDALAAAPPGSTQTRLTREKWLLVLLRELGFGRVPPTPAGGITIDGTAFPVSHRWEDVPIHLLGWGTDLDTRTKGVPGAAGAAPQSMVQELLNRSDAHLWAVVSNGRVLRLLRDSASLVGQAYVEFDVEAMLDGEVYSDFVLLWLVCHQSRFERLDPDAPTGDCWLERWRTMAAADGTRALDRLRSGVTTALEALGTGFFTHPENTRLREYMATGQVTPADYQRALLRLVYRLLFAFVAEDRNALLDPDAPVQARERYADHFSTARLRRLARTRHGSGHHDLYAALSMVFDGLGSEGGLPALGLPGLGGLYEPTALDDPLTGARLSNRALLSAIRALSVVQPKAGGPHRVVDYRSLGAEELGSVYESLLELVPVLDASTRNYRLTGAAGNDRKTSGSYYTPTDLVDLVLDTALDPLLDEAVKADEPEPALLKITVLDPAMGSAHFLVGAARRIAKRLAAARTGDAEPAPGPVAQAMHDVVARCLYGVDLNPMAVELAKVSLWLEALQPGRPLSFLDAHLKVGNALLGVTPRLLADGLPDEAFVTLTGDDKKWTTALKKRNRVEREQSAQGELFTTGGIDVANTRLQRATAELDTTASSASLADEHARAQRYTDLRTDPAYARARRVADAWCAAFVQPKHPGAPAITHATLQALQDDPDSVTADVIALIDDLAARHRFLHWHLEFPQLFGVGIGVDADPETGWTGGVTCVLGNPPWERIKLQEQEFFATRDPNIAVASNAAARKKAIAQLEDSDPALLGQFQAALRHAEGEGHLMRSCGRYPLTGRGDVNTYSVFAETMRTVTAAEGLMGVITPTGLATDATTAPFFADTLAARRLAAFYDFENEAKIFAGVHNQFRFALTAIAGRERRPEVVRFAFYTRYIRDVPAREFALAADEVLLLNPNTGTLPVFRSRVDAEVTLGVYRRFPILIRDGDPAGNPWGLRFMTVFHMAGDSGLFRTADDLGAVGAGFDGWEWSDGQRTWLPLYEAKLLSHWDNRVTTYRDASREQLNKGTLPRTSDEQKADSFFEPLVRYWVADTEVASVLDDRWDQDWLFGWRDIARASDARTFVPCALPRTAVGHKFPLALPADLTHGSLLQAVWSSFAFDYVARQKISSASMTYFIVRQLACPPPSAFDVPPPWDPYRTLGEHVRDRVRELAYTSWRMAPYARDMGDDGPPFRWLPERREAIRAELDAMMFHLFGLDRGEVEHVMDSFFVVRKYDARDHGEFRTKRLILEYYDQLADASATGVPYLSVIDPPPGHGPRHDESTRPDWAKEQ